METILSRETPQEIAQGWQTFTLCSLLCLIPLGISAQLGITAILYGTLLFKIFTGKKKFSLSLLQKKHGLLTSLFILSITLATLFNTQQTHTRFVYEGFGFSLWALTPILFSFVFEKLSPTMWKALGKTLAIVCLIWGLIALSQEVIGWRVLGAHITEDVKRARGLYSHPLTLAYASLLLWPLACTWLFSQPRSWQSWSTFFGVGSCITFSQSRTVQAVALLCIGWNIFTMLSGKVRILLLACLLATIATVAFTKNPISQRFHETLSTQGADRWSEYPDDRLAFWDVHWLMIKERPLFGHGFGLNTEYRIPYYIQKGLKDFKKPYEAHNLFIQILANGGFFALLVFLAWLALLFQYLRKEISSLFVRSVGMQTLFLFLLASLTQNSFQDASVRMVLTSAVTLLFLF